MTIKHLRILVAVAECGSISQLLIYKELTYLLLGFLLLNLMR